MKFLKISLQKAIDFFPAGSFFLMLQVNVYRSALIPTKLPFPEKFLVTSLYSISDHLPQFLIAPHIFQMFQTEKPIYLNMIGQNSTVKNSFQTTSQQAGFSHLKLQNNNINIASFQNLFDSMNNILDEQVPFTKITKYILKLRTKPWIIPALQKPFLLKIKFLKIMLKRKT